MLGAEFVFRDRAQRKGKDYSLSAPSCEVAATDKAQDVGRGECGPAALRSRSGPMPLPELLPEVQGKKMLQQVGSFFLAILCCLSSSLTSIFQ